jgi:tellurite resistance protein
MAITALLDASARAFAMVAYADGNLALIEEARFAKFAASDPALQAMNREDVRDAWARAIKDVQTSPSFGSPLLAIRNEIVAAGDKATVMRAAQAAVVADLKIEPQENEAVRLLAEALDLDPDEF